MRNFFFFLNNFVEQENKKNENSRQIKFKKKKLLHFPSAPSAPFHMIPSFSKM